MGHPVSLSVAVAQVVTLRGIQSASLDSLVLRGFPPAENPAFIVEVWDAVILKSYLCGIFWGIGRRKVGTEVVAGGGKCVKMPKWTQEVKSLGVTAKSDCKKTAKKRKDKLSI